MYMQLQQHDQASNQFYSGLGLLAAGMYPGRNPKASMQWAQSMQQDPNSMFNNLVQIHGMQQQQASLDAFNRSIPDLATKLHMTPDEIRAAGPAAVSTAIQQNVPPEAMKNWMFAKNQYVGAHANDPGPDGQPLGEAGAAAAFEKQFPMSMAIVGSIPGYSDADRQRMLSLQDWQSKNQGQTPPNFLTNNEAFTSYQKELGDAKSSFSAFNQQSNEALNTIDRLKNNPNLDAALKVMSVTGGSGSDFATQYGMMDPKTKQAIDDIKLLGGQVYTEGFKSTGSRRTQQEVNAIVAGLSKVGNYGESNYANTVLNPLADRIKDGLAINYGGAQELDSVPDSLKPSLAKNGIYLPGGSLYSGQGGKGWYLKGMSDADRQKAYDSLPTGAVYIDTDGQPHKKT